MITKETCERIWVCYREIETGRQLLKEVAETIERSRYDTSEPTLKDHFGRRRGLQLGIPSGDTGHRIFNVPFPLATYIIEAHIAAQQKELAEYQIKARMELDGVAPSSATEAKEGASHA